MILCYINYKNKFLEVNSLYIAIKGLSFVLILTEGLSKIGTTMNNSVIYERKRPYKLCHYVSSYIIYSKNLIFKFLVIYILDRETLLDILKP